MARIPITKKYNACSVEVLFFAFKLKNRRKFLIISPSSFQKVFVRWGGRWTDFRDHGSKKICQFRVFYENDLVEMELVFPSCWRNTRSPWRIFVYPRSTKLKQVGVFPTLLSFLMNWFFTTTQNEAGLLNESVL